MDDIRSCPCGKPVYYSFSFGSGGLCPDCHYSQPRTCEVCNQPFENTAAFSEHLVYVPPSIWDDYDADGEYQCPEHIEPLEVTRG